MKKIIYSFLFLGIITALTGCKDESYEDLIPQKYEKILYLKTNGQQNLYLFNDGSSTDYTVTVGKTGSNPSATAQAQLKIMTQEEINKDEHYTGNNYTVLSSNCYEYQTKTLDFTSVDAYKSVTIKLIPTKISEEVQANTNPNAVFILPIRLSSQTDSVNTEKCDLILKTKVTDLGVSFKKNSKVINLNTNKDNSIILEADIAMVSGVQNAWNFTVGMELLTAQSILEDYNTANKTSYLMIPNDANDGIENAVFENGNNESASTITIKRNKLSKGYSYLVPLKLKPIEEIENIKVNEKLFYGILDYPLDETNDKITLIASMLSDPFNYGGGDGTKIDNLVDDKAETYYHIKYGAPIGDATYGQPFDITLSESIKSIMFQYITRHNNGNGAPTRVKLFVSNDKTNWTELSDISNGLPTTTGTTYKSKVFAAEQEFKYLRFSVMSIPAGVCTGEYNNTWALAEFKLWGSK